MEAFSPELCLLLALLRSALVGSRIAPPPAGTIEWRRFLDTVERHRLGAFLYKHARDELRTICPREVILRLEESSQRTLHRALAQALEQNRLGQLLESTGINVIAVKGLVLAQQLHGGLGTRHVGDIDLLIRPAEAEKADRIFQADGLRRTRPDFPLTPRQTEKYLRLKPEFEYVRASSTNRVELLWRIEGIPATEPVWADAVPCTIGGRPWRTLPPEINIPYLFQHGARHGWFRLFWLIDVAVLLRDPAIPWERIMARARELKMERSLLQGAVLAENLLGVALPPALRPAPAEEPAITALAAEAKRQIARDVARDEPAGEWFRQFSYRVRLQRGARAKFSMIEPHLFSPLNWHTLPLPDRWFFLYYFATPFLWAWRRLQRDRAK